MSSHSTGALHALHVHTGHILGWTARSSALLGGVIMLALAIVTTVSILGRWLSGLAWIAATPWLGWVGSITGNYEMVEMGAATAVAAFMPYCQMRGGHVCVEVFVMAAPRGAQILLTAFANLVFTLATGFITWRLALGMEDKMSYGETTMVLSAPVWWGYAPCVAFFGLFTLVCAYTTVDALVRFTGRPGIDFEGAEEAAGS